MQRALCLYAHTAETNDANVPKRPLSVVLPNGGCACLAGLTPGASASFQSSLSFLQVSIGTSSPIVMVDTVETFRVSRDVEFTQAEAGLDNQLIHPQLFWGVIHYSIPAAHQPRW